MVITFEGSVSGGWGFDYCFSFEERNRLMYHSNRNSVALILKKNRVLYFRVLGFEFWVLGFEFRVLGFEFRVLGFEFRVLGFEFRVLRFEFRVLGFRIFGF
jgi:hypothetical protein